MNAVISTLLLSFVSQGLGLIYPMIKSNGDPDITSITTHITLMEQMITNLQSEVKSTNDKLQSTENELSGVKVKLQATEDELMLARADLKTAETDIAVLKHDLQNGPGSADIANLKSELETLKANNNMLNTPFNFTVIDSDVKSNKQEIRTLTSELFSSKLMMNQTTDLLMSIQGKVDSMSNTSDLASEAVAFQVTQEGHGASRFTKLTFNTVKYNAGNGYDNSSAMFTAPVSGSYIFWTNVYFDTPSNNYVCINKGDEELTSAFSRPSDDSDSRSVSVITAAYIVKGETVHFCSYISDIGGPSGFVHGNGLSSYGGALLFAH